MVGNRSESGIRSEEIGTKFIPPSDLEIPPSLICCPCWVRWSVARTGVSDGLESHSIPRSARVSRQLVRRNHLARGRVGASAGRDVQP